jgi:hypothetical protein
MAVTNVELYEALKEPIGEKAARLIAEVFPAASNVATSQALAEVELRLVECMAALETRIMGRLWVMFVPLWIGVFGLIATLLVKG